MLLIALGNDRFKLEHSCNAPSVVVVSSRLFLSTELSVITLSLLHPVQSTPVQHWTFESESLVRVGRSNDNDVVVYSAVVSRHHVEIKMTNEGWEIVSLGANGTYVEQKRITTLKALDGMVMRLGSSGPKIQIWLGPANLTAKTITAKRSPKPSPTDASKATPTFLTPPKPQSAPIDPQELTHIDVSHLD